MLIFDDFGEKGPPHSAMNKDGERQLCLWELMKEGGSKGLKVLGDRFERQSREGANDERPRDIRMIN
jgi:hypothetical protein